MERKVPTGGFQLTQEEADRIAKEVWQPRHFVSDDDFADTPAIRVQKAKRLSAWEVVQNFVRR